jgi:hypothetical protein
LFDHQKGMKYESRSFRYLSVFAHSVDAVDRWLDVGWRPTVLQYVGRSIRFGTLWFGLFRIARSHLA